MNKRTCLLLSSITCSNVSPSLRHISNLHQVIDMYIKKKTKKTRGVEFHPIATPHPRKRRRRVAPLPKMWVGMEMATLIEGRKLLTCCGDEDTLFPCCKQRQSDMLFCHVSHFNWFDVNILIIDKSSIKRLTKDQTIGLILHKAKTQMFNYQN